MKFLLLITLPFYVLDQVTKALVLRLISPEEFVPVIPGFFNLVQVHNTGAAFGMLKGNNFLFLIIAPAALLALSIFAYRGAFTSNSLRVAAALLASGILGNLTDRIAHGYVIDFLDIILPWYGHWPAFNVADSCICIAAVLFFFAGFSPTRSGINK